MGYRIEYGQTIKREPISDASVFLRKKEPVYTVAIIIAAVMAGICFGTEPARSFILPGDPEITEQALQTFAEQIKDGEPFGSAAAAFCQEIIAGADLT